MKQNTADLLLINGRFLTMEQPGEMAEAVAIAGGRILFVGSEAEARSYAAEGTEVIDLQGRVAAPCLIDCHTHPMGSYSHRFVCTNLRENGIPVGCNSDCPVCDVNPMLGIHSMVTRITETGRSFGGTKEAIDRMKALEAYTCRAAGLLCLEDVAGTLTPGKYADLVVFNEDYLAVPDEALKNITMYMTISGGEIVYKKA